ncbi:MAG TPA: hypothetical protein VFB06_12975 [Streptosporangiaceae bacterium]|nr:hypothetical protein [Streptosporangiaceae bacterium]
MSTDAAFWIDYEYDRVMASDGRSRFASYVRRASASGEWAECWDGTWDDDAVRAVQFASASWRVATSPVMSPGYVRHHNRIRSARVEVNPWDTSLCAAVEIIIPQPRQLAAARDSGNGSMWWDWQQENHGGEQVYLEPSEQELSRYRYMLATTKLAFPLPTSGLPTAPDGPGAWIEDAAERAVTVLCNELQQVVRPVLAVLENN